MGCTTKNHMTGHLMSHDSTYLVFRVGIVSEVRVCEGFLSRQSAVRVHGEQLGQQIHRHWISSDKEFAEILFRKLGH